MKEGNKSCKRDECNALIDELSRLKEQLRAAEEQLNAYKRAGRHNKAGKPAALYAPNSQEQSFDLSETEGIIAELPREELGHESGRQAFYRSVLSAIGGLSDSGVSSSWAMLLCDFGDRSDRENKATLLHTDKIDGLINASTRQGDVVAYISPGERAIFTQCDAEGHSATTLADRLIKGLNNYKFDQSGQCGEIKCRIGIALYPHDASDVDTLFRYADRALYTALRIDDSYYAFYL